MKRSFFLSHTSSDKDLAREIYHALTGHGIEVWFDEAEIPWGGELWEHIARAIDRVHVLGVLLTPHAVTAPWVLDELRYADWTQRRGGHVRVLPLLRADCELPPHLRDMLYVDLRGRELTTNLPHLVDFLLGRWKAVPRPRRLRLIELVQEAGPGRWSVWSRDRLERAALVDAVRSMTDEELSIALRLGSLRGDRSEAELVDELAATTGSPGTGRRALRHLVEIGLLEPVNTLSREGEHYGTGILAHALQRAALRSGLFTEIAHIAHGAPEPERLSELLHWRSPSSSAGTYSLSGDGWRAVSLGKARPRAPRREEIALPAILKSATIQVEDPPVHAFVSRHNPPVTWIFRGPDDTQPEVVPSVLSLQDLRLRDEQQLFWNRGRVVEHYPEIDLATFDDLGRLTGLDH